MVTTRSAITLSTTGEMMMSTAEPDVHSPMPPATQAAIGGKH